MGPCTNARALLPFNWFSETLGAKSPAFWDVNSASEAERQLEVAGSRNEMVVLRE
jgi:hypothetical protein